MINILRIKKKVQEKAHLILTIFLVISLSVILGLKATQLTYNSQPRLVQQKSNLLTAPKIKNESTESAQLLQTKLEKYLTVEAALLGVSDTVSLYFQDLNKNINISIDPAKSWIPASTIKSFVALEAFRQKRAGILDLDQTVIIKSSNVVPTELETDAFPRLREGINVTVRQLIEAMIIQSDNTAYNTLLDILDRRSITSYLRGVGITETVVGEKLNLDNNQFQADLQVAGRQPNTTTAKDLASLFQLLYNNQIPDSKEILDIFQRQKINNMIPAFLPNGTTVAHKTGDWAPIYHDGGIVYKPSDPFILTVFTNSNNPSVVAKLAQVAYYQNADSVGQNISNDQTPNKPISLLPEYILAETSSTNKVLGVSIQDTKFPDITAADLGITADDLSTDTTVSKNISDALITPGSLLYSTKRLFENVQLTIAKYQGKETQSYLKQSENRLSEAKVLANQGDLQAASQLIEQSEDNLSKAATLAIDNKESNLGVIQTKQGNDLQFAVLAQIAQSVDSTKKEQFVDIVYNLYQKNQQQVIPKIQSQQSSNPLNQKPIIATVESISGNTAIVKLDDGTTKQVVTNTTTPVRSFEQSSSQTSNSITSGSKIAIVGQTTTDGKIVPQFILSNVPKELPAPHTGVVVGVNPQKNTLIIQDQFGQKIEVATNTDTVLKGRDTSISVSGIKSGSTVTIFGQIEQVPASPTNGSPSPTSTNSKSSAVPLSTSASKSLQTSSPPINSGNNNEGATTTVIKATTVTVLKNSSGAHEVSKPPPRQNANPTPANKPSINLPTSGNSPTKNTRPPAANNPPSNKQEGKKK